MIEFLSAINPWYLLFNILGWCVVAVVVFACAGSFFGFLGGMVRGIIKGLRRREQ